MSGSYDELVKALRYCAESGDFNCNKDCPMYPNYPKCLTKMDMDAAAAIEELQSILTEADKKQSYQHDYICELVAEKEELQATIELMKLNMPDFFPDANKVTLPKMEVQDGQE